MERKKKQNRGLLSFAMGMGTVLLGVFLVVLPASGLFRQTQEKGRNTTGRIAVRTSPEGAVDFLIGRIGDFSSSARVSSLVLDAPYLDQRKSYPTGCESVTAVMALQYFGVEIDTEEFIDKYLPLGNAPYRDETGRLVGCDPRKSFPGDPRTEQGWGCYAPVIEQSLNDLLSDLPADPGLTVESPENKSLKELCAEYVAKGIPVILWATIDMAPPEQYLSFRIEGTEEEFQWIYPLHCLLLVGWDEDGYLFNDPAAGKKQFYSKEAAERAYEGLGRQAIVLVPED